MYSFCKVGNENCSRNQSMLGTSSTSPNNKNNDHEETRLTEADIQRRSQENKERWRYVLSVFDPIKGMPDRKLTRKHLSGNSKTCTKRKVSKKSNFPKLEHVFQYCNKKNGEKIPRPFGKKIEPVGSNHIQRNKSTTIDEKRLETIWLSTKEVYEDEAKLGRGIFSSSSRSKILAIPTPTNNDVKVETFESKLVKRNSCMSAHQPKSEIISTSASEKFGDSVKSAYTMQNSSISGIVVAKSSNVMKPECGRQNGTPNLRVVSNPSNRHYSINKDYNTVRPFSESDDGSETNETGSTKKVFAGNIEDLKSLNLLTDPQKNEFNENLANYHPSTSKVITNLKGNDDYNIVWASSDSEDERRSSKVFTNNSANEDFNIVWSSSDSEDAACPTKNKSFTRKTEYGGSNIELNLLIQAIEKDRRRSNAIREKCTTKKGGYSEMFKNTIDKAKMDFGFLDYEQRAVILQGMFAVLTKIEKSYGVCTANVKLENDNCFRFILDRRVESANVGDKVVSFVNSFRFYTVNNLNIFIQPNKVVPT